MSKVRSLHSRRIAEGRVGGRIWQALLIFAPLLLLAGLGVRGLQVNRRAVLDEARESVSRDLKSMLAGWADPFQRPDVQDEWVRLYPIPPRPAPPNPAQKLYREALDAPVESRGQLLGEFIENDPDALAESGVPLAALAAWAQWQIDRKPEPLLEAVVVRHPSILTAEFLRRAALDANERWEKDESVRAIMRADADAEGWTPHDEPAVWIESGRGISRNALHTIAAEQSRKLDADWAGGFAAANIRFHGIPLVTPPGADGPSTAEVLAHGERFGFEVDAVLADHARLYAPIERQTAWLAGLLICALGAAGAGFWALRRSLERERELGVAKSNFVSAVSHELRAPIASMRLMAENLESEGVVEPARRGEYHRLIAEECRRLSVLIENVLDFARIEQGRKAYHFAETDVDELVRDAVRLLQPRAAQRGQRVNAELTNAEFGMRSAECGESAFGREDSIPHCDALAIQQAVINLIDNALKFSPANTTVTVRLAAVDDAQWSLSVADEGPGIPVGEREKIFERFYRIGSELCRETQGAGIGLSLVLHIAEAHGGRVTVDCPPNGGTVFTLTLPFQPLPPEKET